MSIRKLVNNSIWSILSKCVNGIIQLISLPILLKAFGKENYGLIVIATSLNTFFVILQLGFPTGLPKFVAEWLAKKDYQQIYHATRTVLSFYLTIATLNMLVILGIAIFVSNIFIVKPDQVATLQILLVIVSISSFISIPVNSLDQLLTGAQELDFISYMDMVNNLIFVVLVIYIYFDHNSISLVKYYVLRCLIVFTMIPFKLWKWNKYSSLKIFIPGWSFKSVIPLLKYCISLMILTIFVVLAERFRPIILGVRVNSNAGKILADYEIINSIRLFVIMVVSSLTMALVPYISSELSNGNNGIYKKMIVKGTKFVWSVGALIGFGILMLSKEILCIYVGPENLYLQKWLVTFVGASIYYFYNVTITSAILSSGKTTPLAIGTSIACICSLLTCWFMTPQYGVGAAAMSLIVYNAIHLAISHFWYLPKYFDISPGNQITSIMLPPVFAGLTMCFAGRQIINQIGISNNYENIVIGVFFGTLIYIGIMLAVYIRPKEVRFLLAKQ